MIGLSETLEKLKFLTEIRGLNSNSTRDAIWKTSRSFYPSEHKFSFLLNKYLVFHVILDQFRT